MGFVFVFGCACGVRKSPGQGSNQSHHSNNAKSSSSRPSRKSQVSQFNIDHPYPNNTPPTWIHLALLCNPPALQCVSISFCLSPYFCLFLFLSARLLFLPYFFLHTCPASLCNVSPLVALAPNLSDCPKCPYVSAFSYLPLQSPFAFRVTPLLSQLHFLPPHSLAPQVAMLPALFLPLLSLSVLLVLSSTMFRWPFSSEVGMWDRTLGVIRLAQVTSPYTRCREGEGWPAEPRGQRGCRDGVSREGGLHINYHIVLQVRNPRSHQFKNKMSPRLCSFWRLWRKVRSLAFTSFQRLPTLFGSQSSSSIFKASRSRLNPSIRSLQSSFCLPLPLLKTLVITLGTLRTFRRISLSQLTVHLNHFCKLNSPYPDNVTYSQVLGTTM